MAQPAVIPVKTGQKVPSVFGQWKAVITPRQGGDAYACVGTCILALIIKLKEEKHDRYRAISKNPGI